MKRQPRTCLFFSVSSFSCLFIFPVLLFPVSFFFVTIFIMTSFPPVSTEGHNSLQKSMIQYVNRRLEENVDIKKCKRFDYSDESVDFIKESLIKNDFNIKKDAMILLKNHLFLAWRARIPRSCIISMHLEYKVLFISSSSYKATVDGKI